MSVQNVSICHRKATYIAGIIKGSRQTIANAGNPAVTNWYIAKKNRRKSNITLPPFSREYATT